MTRPAAGEPLDVEWRARTISRASRSENVEDPSTGFRSLLQNPVTVLTHDRDSIVNDCLAQGESGKKVLRVELLRQSKVDILHRQILTAAFRIPYEGVGGRCLIFGVLCLVVTHPAGPSEIGTARDDGPGRAREHRKSELIWIVVDRPSVWLFHSASMPKCHDFDALGICPIAVVQKVVHPLGSTRRVPRLAGCPSIGATDSRSKTRESSSTRASGEAGRSSRPLCQPR